MKTIARLLLFLAVAFQTSAAAPTELRGWKSTAGTTLQAKATAIENGVVLFQSADGRVVKVPLAKLVEEDRKTLQDHFKVEDATGEPAKLAHPSGETSGPIDAGGSNYFVYIPKSLKAGRTYPMIFYTGSGGGDAGTLNEMKEGAEICGWIAACSVESKNGSTSNPEHAERCVAHLKKGLPIDPKRIYFSGNSGGARSAYKNAADLGGAGVLGRIAGAQPGELKKGCHYFFISGSYDYNRYDTSHSFAQVQRSSAFRFHPSGHSNGPAYLMTEGMVWLESQWHRKARTKGPERAEFEKAALAWVADTKTAASHRAAWWAAYLAEGGVSAANQADLASLQTELSKTPEHLAYITALKELEEFAADVLAELPRGAPACFEHTSPEIQKKVEKLQEANSSTPEVKEVLEALKRPTDKG